MSSYRQAFGPLLVVTLFTVAVLQPLNQSLSGKPAEPGSEAAGAAPSAALQSQSTALTNGADLLLFDDYLKAEQILNQRPAGLSAGEVLAFRGEVEFRKGHFSTAEDLYRKAIATDSKIARAHSGLGKLAMAKLHIDDAI